MAAVILLGPQRRQPTLASVMQEAGFTGPVAAITAGWEDREREDGELRDHLSCEVIQLGLWGCAEQLLTSDAELAQFRKRYRDRVGEARRLYRIRLDHSLAALREVFERRRDAEVDLAERQDALEAVRLLDAHFLKQLAAARAEWSDSCDAHGSYDLAHVRNELTDLLEQAELVAIAGGHVVSLLDLLRFFDLGSTLAQQPLVAWSAGAMALCDLVVGFHDHPPQGAGNAELLDAGLGLCPDLVVLPHAKDRLELDDVVRVALLSRRFSPAHAVAFEGGTELHRSGDRWTSQKGVDKLEEDGHVRLFHQLQSREVAVP